MYNVFEDKGVIRSVNVFKDCGKWCVKLCLVQYVESGDI